MLINLIDNASGIRTYVFIFSKTHSFLSVPASRLPQAHMRRNQMKSLLDHMQYAR